MTIRRRSKSREVALQALFQLECPRRTPFPFDEFIGRRLHGKDQAAFCRKLVMGTRAFHREIDGRISDAAENWRIERMAGVDRNILRMGAYEMLYQPETSVRVILDEAVELAKRFGSEDSPKFVNGVLDQLLRGIPARLKETLEKAEETPENAGLPETAELSETAKVVAQVAGSVEPPTLAAGTPLESPADGTPA